MQLTAENHFCAKKKKSLCEAIHVLTDGPKHILGKVE